MDILSIKEKRIRNEKNRYLKELEQEIERIKELDDIVAKFNEPIEHGRIRDYEVAIYLSIVIGKLLKDLTDRKIYNETFLFELKNELLKAIETPERITSL